MFEIFEEGEFFILLIFVMCDSFDGIFSIFVIKGKIDDGRGSLCEGFIDLIFALIYFFQLDISSTAIEMFF